MKHFLTSALFSLAAIVVCCLGAPRAEADGTVPGILAQFNGDADANGQRDINDAVYLLDFIFRGGPPPRPLVCEPGATVHNGDVNGNGLIDISDPISLLGWLFLGDDAPVEGCPLPGV